VVSCQIFLKRRRKMSCFIVSPKNVVSLARKSLKYFSDFRNNTGIDMEEIFGIEEEDSENMKIRKIVKELHKLNVRAMKERYDYLYKEEPFIVDIYKYSKDLYQLYKYAQCYLYNCLEGDCDESPVYKFIKYLKGKITDEIISASWEYEKAEWN
jgi:UDP-N-acetylglucosamine pyrophosphorylase